MTHERKSELIRRYAAGETSWRELREQGFEDYIQVLAMLADLGLRIPTVPMEGPDREARERGIAMLRRALQALP